MFELIQDRLSGWGARMSFGALLLVCSELIVWQTPTDFNLLEWIGLAVLYVALAAIMLDLIARFNVNDVFSLFLIAGIYGLLNATLISHITTRDLPLSLIVRPLSAQPLAFMLALLGFQILASGRATGPLDFLVALVVGLVWGIWVRWFPVVSDEPIPVVEVGTAVAAVGIGLVLSGALRYALPPAMVFRPEDWRLHRAEWALAGGVLLAALALGVYQDTISRAGIGIVIMLSAFMVMILYITLAVRQEASFLQTITPPRLPNPAAWLILLVPLLAAGWVGYKLPGSGDSALQSDLLFGALTGFGIMWLPAVSTVIGVRAFIQLAREGV